MKLDQSFTVKAPPRTVYETLLHIERVASCLPGADINEQRDDGSWGGTFTVKLGPTTASYNGAIKIEERDDEAMKARLAARGQDRRGQGGASATIDSIVHDDLHGGTRVEVSTDYTITGKLARFGRGGMVQDIANRMLKDFAENLEAMLTADQGAAAQAAPEQAAPEPAGDAPAADGASPAPEAGPGPAAVPPRPQAAPPPRPQAAELDAGSLMFRALLDRLQIIGGTVKGRPAPFIVLALLLVLLGRRRGRRTE
ncbi:MAG TPA: SRPBCC family protein [Baekduia sp.]|nr:SRPBCC family protein [Baekduia sp.]